MSLSVRPAHSQSVPHILAAALHDEGTIFNIWMCTALMMYVSEKPLCVTCGGITIICQTPSPPTPPPPSHLLPPLSDYSTDDVYGRSLEEEVAISPSTAGTHVHCHSRS